MNNLSRLVLALWVAAVAVPMAAQPALPQLDIVLNLFESRLEPRQPAVAAVYVTNHGAAPATNVVLTVTLPEGGTIVMGRSATTPPTCTTANNTLVCTSPMIGTGQQTYLIDVQFAAPARTTGEDFVIHATVTSAETDADPSDNEETRTVAMVRQFAVMNVADEGSGSLRQAIHDVNTLCPFPKPCAITFQIPVPVPESGWFTIQPRTEYPEIVGSVKIDGLTQTSFTGNTNLTGPEIEINGALLTEGSGLRLQPNCDVDVANLAVNGFPGYGVVIRRMPFAVDPCIVPPFGIRGWVRDSYLGTDPTGQVAKPNQRGLGLFVMESAVYNNLISGNLRAGIYAAEGFFTDITSNRITDNGAGIFFDMGDTRFGNPGGADVQLNVIAENRGMAIARTRRGEIFITNNSMFDNLQQGIDVDVDGVSPIYDHDLEVPNAPVLYSATFFPGPHYTVIRGYIDSETPSNRNSIEVYASERLSGWGTAQAEVSKGRYFVDDIHQDFEIIVPGDLRGKWITATHIIANLHGFIRTPPGGVTSQTHRQSHPANTSELSHPILAQ